MADAVAWSARPDAPKEVEDVADADSVGLLTIASGFDVAFAGQPLTPVLSQRFQQAVPDRIARAVGDHHRLSDEIAEHVEDLDLAGVLSAAIAVAASSVKPPPKTDSRPKSRRSRSSSRS